MKVEVADGVKVERDYEYRTPIGNDGRVYEVGKDLYEVVVLLDELDVHEMKDGTEYVLDRIPGVTANDISGMSVYYHRIWGPKSMDLPRYFVEKRGMFRIVCRDSYVTENIVEMVRDVDEAKKVLDSARKELISFTKSQALSCGQICDY
jgi:hypothetical protein